MNDLQPMLGAALYCLIAVLLVAWVLVPFVLFDIRRELKRANDNLEHQNALLVGATKGKP